MNSLDFWSVQQMRAVPVYVLKRTRKLWAYPRHVMGTDPWQNGQTVTMAKGTLLTYNGINGGMNPSMCVVRVTKTSNRMVVTGDWCEVPVGDLGFSHYLIVDGVNNVRMQYDGEV